MLGRGRQAAGNFHKVKRGLTSRALRRRRVRTDGGEEETVEVNDDAATENDTHVEIWSCRMIGAWWVTWSSVTTTIVLIKALHPDVHCQAFEPQVYLQASISAHILSSRGLVMLPIECYYRPAQLPSRLPCVLAASCLASRFKVSLNLPSSTDVFHSQCIKVSLVHTESAMCHLSFSPARQEKQKNSC